MEDWTGRDTGLKLTNYDLHNEMEELLRKYPNGNDLSRDELSDPIDKHRFTR